MNAKKKILSIDVGGTHVKLLVSTATEPRKFKSGPTLTPRTMVEKVRSATSDWVYSVVSIGLPGPVVHGRLTSQPVHLGAGWVGFDFAKAMRRPVELVNDAAMQALGNDTGGRLLFLGLGTGLGSAMIVNGRMEPMEVGHLPYKKGKSYEDYLGAAGLKRLGKKKWEKHVWAVVDLLRRALGPDRVVVGGGNAHSLD
ncbi:MAG: ROK family protein, partial [bacterium]